MQRKILSRGLLALALAGVAAAALAGDPKTFVTKAAQGGMTEVELGKLALSKSQDANVRAFAQRMVTDHGKANAQLAAIAKSKNVPVPKTLDAEHASMVKELQSKSGAAFDSAYGEHMRHAHDKTIELFEGEAKTPSDGDLAEFASQKLPTVREHKQMAQKLPGS
jgi:putative membrane protein